MGGNINIRQLSQRGLWLFGMDWSGSPLYVAHSVLPDQLELDPATGRPRPIQAERHQVWLWSMTLNLYTQLGVTPWMNVRLQFPLRFVQVSARFTDEQGSELQNYQSIHHRNELLVGVGDPDLQVGFRPFRLTRNQPWLFEFGGGVSFPLGRTEADPYKAGREGEKHQHIMFGSGTFDPIGFFTVGYIHPRFQLYANASVRGALYTNVHNFQEGTRLQGSLTAESGFGLKRWSFQVAAALAGQWPGLWSGRIDADAASGRTDLLLSAGVFWRPTSRWQIAVRASVPITLHVVGGDFAQPVLLSLGLNYRFRLFR